MSRWCHTAALLKVRTICDRAHISHPGSSRDREPGCHPRAGQGRAQQGMPGEKSEGWGQVSHFPGNVSRPLAASPYVLKWKRCCLREAATLHTHLGYLAIETQSPTAGGAQRLPILSWEGTCPALCSCQLARAWALCNPGGAGLVAPTPLAHAQGDSREVFPGVDAG